MGPSARPSLVVNASVMATVSAVLPGFLIGALSVQVSAEMGVSEAVYGWGFGSFFGAATLGSVLSGRLAQRIGPRKQMSAALIVSCVAQLALAATARSFAAVIGCLVVAGLANSAMQSSVNLALAEARPARLGLAMSIKQSSLPASTMLAGLAVPSLALTAGWRWAYVACAALSLVSLVLVRTAVSGSAAAGASRSSVPESPTRDLYLAAVAGAFLAFGAGVLNAWGVASGVDAGLGPGAAGLMLSVGAVTGITLRLVSGWLADTMRAAPFSVGGYTALVGAVGMAGLALRSPSTHVLAMLVAFGGGWIWPVFTNYGIVRTNPRAAGAATGVTQTGVFVGVFVAPLITGWLIEHHGYETMWLAAAAALVIGAGFSIRLADRF